MLPLPCTWQHVEGFSANVVAKFFGFLPGEPAFWTYAAEKSLKGMDGADADAKRHSCSKLPGGARG